VRTLIDTHVLLWLGSDDPRLGRKATQRIDAALRADDLLVSAISFWEIAMLAVKRRVALDTTPRELRRHCLEQGIRELPIDGAVAAAAAELAHFHGDPADRLIVSSALAQEALLITADRPLLRWDGALPRHDARV
jgi:PIN domain nuclease of toxin-antitoxin system